MKFDADHFNFDGLTFGFISGREPAHVGAMSGYLSGRFVFLNFCSFSLSLFGVEQSLICFVFLLICLLCFFLFIFFLFHLFLTGSASHLLSWHAGSVAS